MRCFSGDAVDVALVDDAAVGEQEVERDRRAAAVPVARSVDRRGRARRSSGAAPRAISSRCEPSASTRAWIGLDPDPVEEAQPDLDGGEIEEVDGAVLEVRRAGSRLVAVALHERGDDRAAGEPRALERVQRLPSCEQRADSRRPAEQLVERDRHEVGMPAGEVEPVRGDEGGGVEEDVASRARGPGRSTRAGAGRPRSSTARDRRRGCDGRRRAPTGIATGGSRRRGARARRSGRTSSRRRAPARTRGGRSPSCGCRR